MIVNHDLHFLFKRRCDATKSESSVPGVVGKQPCQLERFVGNPRANRPAGLPFRLTDYLELVDWTGRKIREDQRGAIGSELPAILDRLDIEEDHWMDMTQNFESSF